MCKQWEASLTPGTSVWLEPDFSTLHLPVPTVHLRKGSCLGELLLGKSGASGEGRSVAFREDPPGWPPGREVQGLWERE